MFISDEYKLRADNPTTTEKIIEDQISRDISSEFKLNAWDGILYYRRKNTYINTLINNRNSKNEKNNNKWTSNHKCGSGFLKKIIDQKVNYLLGKPVVVVNADNCKEIFDINTIIKKAGKEASKKGIEWLHPYINENGEFKVINIDGLECIPIWDTEYENELQQMIRYYQITIIKNDEEMTRYKVEVWDKEKVTYYIQDENGRYYLDSSIENNPLYHYSYNTKLGEKTISTEFGQWGKVPFVPVWNCDDKVNDLENIKSDIDLYDVIKSDFGNNIDRFQEALLMIKNHSASSTEKFLELLKDYGFIEVDEDGDAKWLQLEIPVEARKTFLEIIKNDIYEFGQAVDVKSIGADTTNITNVAIKAKYADLDLKADDFEACITEAIKELYWFVNKFLEITGQKKDDLSKIEVTYNRNIIFNESEKIDNVLKSKGIISDKTATSNHPWVDDVDKELKLIGEDQKRAEELFNDSSHDKNVFDNNNKSGGE